MMLNKPINPDERVSLLVFQVGGQAYGVFVTQVIRIIEMVTIVEIKQVREFIPGLINYQGQAVPVVDMRLRLGFTPQPYGLHTPIILVSLVAEAQSDGEKMLGLIVDEVEQVVEIAMTQLEYQTSQRLTELTSTLTEQIHSAAYLHGVAHIDYRMVMVLNLTELLHVTDYQTVQTHIKH